MRKNVIKNVIIEKIDLPPWIWPCGLAAGFINGLLGAGSGIVLVFTFAAVSKDKSGSRVRDNFAMTISTVLPISILSAYSYFQKTNADIKNSLVFIIPGIVGGLLGALITDKISATVLKMIFAAITIIAGVNMILK